MQGGGLHRQNFVISFQTGFLQLSDQFLGELVRRESPLFSPRLVVNHSGVDRVRA